MTDSPAPLTDDDLLGLLRKEVSAAANYQASALTGNRLTALKYYDRELYATSRRGCRRS